MKESKKLIERKTYKNNELQLWEHTVDGRLEYELIINGVFIMATYNFLSSELLIRNAIRELDLKDGKILIGGLGFGFSVKEACLHEEKLKDICVVEANLAVIDWNRSILRELNGKYLEDERVRLVHGNFISYVGNTNEKFDVICMDIDNGPMLLIYEENRRAYTTGFYQKINGVLNKPGVFSVWSGNEDRGLYENLKKIFGNCRVEEVTENHFGKDVPYYLYTAGKA